MSNIELVIGTIAPGDSIESLGVEFLPLETPVRVLLTTVGPGDMFGTIVGVRLDTGRRGPVRDGAYRPDRYVADIRPNLVSYIVRDDATEQEFECVPSKVLAQ